MDVKEFVRNLSEIPTGVIRKLDNAGDEIFEITPICKGNSVEIIEQRETGIVKEVLSDGLYLIQDAKGNLHEVHGEDLVIDDDNRDYFPVHDTMFAFKDEDFGGWLLKEGNLQIMADIGFRIYAQEDFGYIFGWDGGNCDFYKEYWEPLYQAISRRF